MSLLQRIKANHKIKETKELKTKRSTYQFHIRDNGWVIAAKDDMFISHTNGTSGAFQSITQLENDKVSRSSEDDLKIIT